MGVEAEIYDRITAQIPTVTVYDTKRPDGLVLSAPIIVVQWISAPSETVLQGPIIWREVRLQTSIFAPDLDDARTVRDALITALHNYKAGAIKSSRHENDFVTYDKEDREYHIPVDFIILASQ